MQQTIILILFIIAAYLLGSICSAIIICKIFRLPDPRLNGSRNPGATNVKRLGGNLPAAITLFADGAKSFIPVLIARYFFADPFDLGLIYLAALIGHCYPIFFGFIGGKGVATGIGGLLPYNPIIGAICLAVWLGVILLTKTASLGALVAFFIMPFLIYWQYNLPVTLLMSFASILVFWRHRENIKRMIKTGAD